MTQCLILHWHIFLSLYTVPDVPLASTLVWFAIPSVDHVSSELSTMIRPSWVALHSMAHGFTELCKPPHHDKAVICEGVWIFRNVLLNTEYSCCCYYCSLAIELLHGCCGGIDRCLCLWAAGPSIGPAGIGPAAAVQLLSLCDQMGCNPPDSLSLGFARQLHWSGLPLPSPANLPDTGTESASSVW